ncbi:MAG: hypothetical protein MSS40_00960 [Bacteroidales bacterium]|nr:hypothetical protein [Bacteroidales bacterium]
MFVYHYSATEEIQQSSYSQSPSLKKADKERETILQKLADKVSHCKNLWTIYQLFSLPKSMASASVQPATIVQKGKIEGTFLTGEDMEYPF